LQRNPWSKAIGKCDCNAHNNQVADKTSQYQSQVRTPNPLHQNASRLKSSLETA
jgi:hypothetical protein